LHPLPDTMKPLSILVLASAVLAAPLAIPAPEDTTPNPEVLARQLLPTTEEGLRLGLSCGDVVFIFARGSTEVGNMGTVIGPDLARALDRRLPLGQDLTIQGVNYAALVAPNYLPGGTDLASENEMKNMLRLANTKCPQAKIVVAGYSQGAAVVHRAVEDIEDGIKQKIAAAVCFGDTQWRRDGGRIPNFPTNKYKVFCGGLVRDTVCDGNLAAAVLAPHLSYGSDADEAADFLASKL
jgi:cutinase